MYQRIFAAICALVLLGSACSNNVREQEPPWPIVITQVTVPEQLHGSEAAVWRIEYSADAEPCRIMMDMGGGAAQDLPAGTPATSPFEHSFMMLNPSKTDTASYTYEVIVTNPMGFTAIATGSYSVGPNTDEPPLVESAVYVAAQHALTVTVADADDGAVLTVSVTEPAGMTVDASSKTAAATGPLTAVFYFSADDPLAGAGGDTTVTVSSSDSELVSQQEVLISIAPFALAADSLYAIPLKSSVAIGEPLTVVVATGIPANPFQFMNGIGLTVEADAQRAELPFWNAGAVGGEFSAPDGFWAAMAPSGGFMQPIDGWNWIIPTAIDGGRERWDFNLSPLGGSDLTSASGALFNVTFTFSEPGTKTFGFQEADAIKRTYYSDFSGTEYFWGDIGNSAAPAVEVH